MNLQLLLDSIPKIRTVKLSGSVAHAKMIPSSRLEFQEKLDLNVIQPKSAAVLMLLYPKADVLHLVLIIRNTYEGVHSGQVAFPGGKFEESDLNFEYTALREAEEEVGVKSSKVLIVRPFSELYIAPSNFMVYPFLGICTEEIDFRLDPSEVAQIIELPLAKFLNEDLNQIVTMNTSYGKNIQVPALNIMDNIVWGATAMMLCELKMVLKDVL